MRTRYLSEETLDQYWKYVERAATCPYGRRLAVTPSMTHFVALEQSRSW